MNELEIEIEIENLKLILVDLERKRIEKEHIKGELGEELYLLNQEINNLMKYIKEKEEKRKALETEVRFQYDDIEIFGKWDYNIASSSKASCLAPAIINARLIPVKEDGNPIEQLGESKWTKM